MAMLSRNIQNASAKHSLAEELPCSSLDVGATMLESVFCRLIAATMASRFGLLLAQTKHSEQRRRVKRHEHRDVGRRTCRDMTREDDKRRRLRKIAQQSRHRCGGQCDGNQMVQWQCQAKPRERDSETDDGSGDRSQNGRA